MLCVIVRPMRAVGPGEAARYDSCVTAPLPDLILYGRPGCHLCDEAHEAIELALADRVARGLPVPALVERNIETDPEWHRVYLERIPVLELDGRRLELLVTASKVRWMLADALDGLSGAAAQA
jgi:glutaredoxin-like protein DUF836